MVLVLIECHCFQIKLALGSHGFGIEGENGEPRDELLEHTEEYTRETTGGNMSEGSGRRSGFVPASP